MIFCYFFKNNLVMTALHCFLLEFSIFSLHGIGSHVFYLCSWMCHHWNLMCLLCVESGSYICYLFVQVSFKKSC